MPRELICLQVGQCGNQLGCRFWDIALQEHRNISHDMFDDAMSSFFRNTDRVTGAELPLGGAPRPINKLCARAIPIDMEEGVLTSIKRGPLGSLFDHTHFVSDVSGCGNNWAVGYCDYGPKYRDAILESVRAEAEHCDSLQTFLMMHSLGGGTGSGLGTYILGLLQDEFPHVFRFATVIFPSEDDDVITSPYNSVLSVHQLINHADCVLPVDNQSLMEIADRAQAIGRPPGAGEGGGHSRNSEQISSIAETNPHRYDKKTPKGGRAYDAMNSIAAHMLTNLTASMRFPGLLNIDLNEITTNLVPFPKLHFLIPSVTPLALGRKDTNAGAKRIDQMFSDAVEKDYQMIQCDPKRHKYLACALMARGRDITISDLTRNVERLQKRLHMIYWNKEGFKVGLCSAPPVGQPYSLLCLANNVCFGDVLQRITDRCMLLYRVKAHLYHYTQYIHPDIFEDALENIRCSIDDYETLDAATPPPPNSIPRYSGLV